jgi:hypothetical protein
LAQCSGNCSGWPSFPCILQSSISPVRSRSGNFAGKQKLSTLGLEGGGSSCPALRARDRGDALKPADLFIFSIFFLFFPWDPQGEQDRRVVEGGRTGPFAD